MPAPRYRVSARVGMFAACSVAVAVISAQAAWASNHDVQRAVHGCGSAKHDRALGPLASADAPVRAVN